MNGSGGPSCSSPMPMQTAGRLLLKKLTQWSGETTTSRSGRHAFRRRPISSKPAASLSRWSRGMVSQSRAMIGPWLAAKTPTSSAMGHLLFLGLQRVQAGDELGLRHAADLEVEAQEIGVDQRRDRADVVVEQRLAQFRLDLVAADYSGHVDAILRRQLRVVLEVEEQLAHPIVRHRRASPADGLVSRARQLDPTALFARTAARSRGRSIGFGHRPRDNDEFQAESLHSLREPAQLLRRHVLVAADEDPGA